MRIAFVVGSFPELSETFILDQITGLLSRGHEVVVFGRRPKRGVPLHPLVNESKLLARARYWPGGPWAIFATALRSGRVLVRTPARTLHSLARSLNVVAHGSLAAGGVLWAYTATALQEPTEFDVVLAHFGRNGAIAQSLREVGALSGPLATVFHGHDLSRAVREGGQRRYSRLFQRGDLMLPVSEFFRARLIELGCAPERISVQHMGVDTARFGFYERQPRAGESVRLISVCRLVEKKGIEFGLRAFALALLSGSIDLRWDIVGDGPMRAALVGLAGELGIAQRVQFHGARTRDQVEALLGRAQLFFAPSVTAADGDQEGIPVSIMEAAASGMPVLSTLHSGIPELVEDGGSGYLAPERDVPALAERLRALAAEPEAWPRMGRRGRELVCARFELATLNVQLEQRLEALAAAFARSVKIRSAT